MDPSLHQKQGINHLKKVLNYAPFVTENGEAEVHLTTEDWYVVADTLFQMQTPRELLPAAIEAYRLVDDNTAIELKTADCIISVQRM
ncbi:MAG: hypothetical protein R2834_20915 [Rhodothermales bacterium]